MSDTHEFHRKLAPLFRAMGVDPSPEADENAFVIGVDDKFDVLVHGSDEGVVAFTALVPRQVDAVTQGAIALGLLTGNAPTVASPALITGLDEEGHPLIWACQRLDDSDEEGIVELFKRLVERVQTIMECIDGYVLGSAPVI